MTGSAATLGAASPGSALGDFNTLSFLIHQAIAQLGTTKLVKVVKAPYDRNGNPIPVGSASIIGFIDVQPLVNQMDGSDKPTPHGTVYRLSYHRPMSGNGAFISDPAVGDQGFMTVGDRDGSVVRNTNAQGNPGSSRIMDAADGIYLGQCQGSATPTQYVTFLADGIKWHDTDGNEIITGSSGMIITVAKGNLNATVSNGSATVTVSGGKVTIHSDTGIELTAPPNTIKANTNVIG